LHLAANIRTAKLFWQKKFAKLDLAVAKYHLIGNVQCHKLPSMKSKEQIALEDFPHRVAQLFGEELQRHRRSKGISQEVFAERLGVSRTTISNMECGRQRIFLDHVYRAAEILDVAIHDLMPQASKTTVSREINIAQGDSLSMEEEREIQNIMDNL